MLLIISISFIYNSFSQGCSDAGACSIESINFEDFNANKKSLVKLNLEQTISLGEKFVLIFQTTAGIQFRASKTSLIELRIPFIYVNGNLGQNSGVGDLMISLNQQLFKQNKKSLNLILASRLKSNNSDAEYNSKPLPMAYQSSLGTNDIIFGSLFSIPQWDFYTAYQHSFGRNKNAYLVNDNTISENQQYYESNQLKRGDDIYLRARRFFDLKNENRIYVNSLLIYRIQKDEILKNDENIQINGSAGLTVNLAFTYSRKLKSNRKIDFSLAFPIIDKDYRSDGLTRNLVFGVRIINL
jgi:hypothetical protein